MHESYSDITDRIAEPPKWWDENAVPRFCDFEPQRCAKIYCDEAALVEIMCQGCRKPFHVAFTCYRQAPHNQIMRMLIREKKLHYGDPPNFACCPAGPSMNSEPRRVLQYWSRCDPQFVKDGFVTDTARYFEWIRDPSLEINITPDWVEDAEHVHN